MLNENKKSMIRHHIRARLNALYSYISEKSANPCETIVEMLKTAISTPIQDSEAVGIDKLMGRNPKNPTEPILKELRGIFNPNYKVLNILEILNGYRDKEKVSEEEFPNIAAEIRAYSLIALEDAFSSHIVLDKYLYLLPKFDADKSTKQKDVEEKEQYSTINKLTKGPS
ncbi:MAG TPA: hypothetical protein VHA13_00300 [Gammaproteobacteria bacterium]|nr:hypothetical protein [Gammaproteobacteria bacterium]